MNQLIECVPNFSEGRDLQKIKQITNSIEAVTGIKLLSVEPGADANRTVVTFIGSPESVEEAAFQAIAKAYEVIDMTSHKGGHPRMGATDVCPFIPVEGVNIEDCVKLSHRVGKRVGQELKLPIYFYEESAKQESRKNLAQIRRGEYEGLKKKLSDPQWKPDEGPSEFIARYGATVMGVREFLIAYNITLNTTDKSIANDIAFEIREKGRTARQGNIHPFYFKGNQFYYKENAFPCGNCNFVGKTYAELKTHCQEEHQYDLDQLLRINDLNPDHIIGERVHRAGAFDFCKAIGWYVEEYNRAQISINLTNYKVTSMHDVLEKVRELATQRGVIVTGSEIVGLVPFQALLESGKYYLKKQQKSIGIPAPDILRTAVFSLGLNDVSPFDLNEKVLGLPDISEQTLACMTVIDFSNEVSRDTPAPGGGSIAALAGTLGASLTSMVANLTHGSKNNTTDLDQKLNQIAEQAQEIKDCLLKGIDADTDAFNAFIDAKRLPNNTAEEKNLREKKMNEGMRIAIDVPWATAELCFKTLELAKEIAEIGNPNSLTDAAVGGQMAFSGIRGGIWNVLINLKDISSDVDFVHKMQKQCQDLLSKAEKSIHELNESVDSKLKTMIQKSL